MYINQAFINILHVFRESDNIENLYPNITLFSHKQLQVNIIDNAYVPKHTKLSSLEKIHFLVSSYHL